MFQPVRQPLVPQANNRLENTKEQGNQRQAQQQPDLDVYLKVLGEADHADTFGRKDGLSPLELHLYIEKIDETIKTLDKGYTKGLATTPKKLAASNMLLHFNSYASQDSNSKRISEADIRQQLQ